MLTPTRKKIGKAVARGSKYAIVRECFTDPKTRQFVLNYLGNIICKEIKTMVSLESNSILQSSKLEDFKWDMLLNELNKINMLLSLLIYFNASPKPKPNVLMKKLSLACVPLFSSSIATPE